MGQRAWLAVNVGVGLLAFALVVPFSLLDFDGYHDGLLLGAAIGIVEGRELFSEVFSHFGPVTTWLHAGFLQFWPGGEAAGLRILSSALIAAIFFMLADLGRVAPTAWDLRPKITFFGVRLVALI